MNKLDMTLAYLALFINLNISYMIIINKQSTYLGVFLKIYNSFFSLIVSFIYVNPL